MRFPESISAAEYAQISKRSLRLFLSVDIVNSTALKQDFKDRGASWLEIAHSFYTRFPTLLSSTLAEEVSTHLLPMPELWKAIGDELVFVVEIEVMKSIPSLLSAFQAAVNSWNCEYEEKRVAVKAAAWLAGFPVANSVIPGDAEERYDYIGSSIDTGFRVCRFASPRRFALSIDLVAVLAKLDALIDKLHYMGRKELKGVLRDRPYPVFWLDCYAEMPRPGFAELSLSEDDLTGENQSALERDELERFVFGWILSTDGAVEIPFPPRARDPRFPVPDNYAEIEASKLAEFEREFLSESNLSLEDGSEIPEGEAEALTTRLRSQQKQPPNQ